MKRGTLLTAIISSIVSAGLTTVVLLLALLPSIVEAQVARVTAEGLTVVRSDGLEGLTAEVRPDGGGVLQVLGVDGQTVRVQVGAGGTRNCAVGEAGAACRAGGNAGVSIMHPDGTLATRVGLLGQTITPGVQLVDAQGNVRFRASLDLEGNPTVQLFDAEGAVIWSAP